MQNISENVAKKFRLFRALLAFMVLTGFITIVLHFGNFIPEVDADFDQVFAQLLMRAAWLSLIMVPIGLLALAVLPATCSLASSDVRRNKKT